MRIWKRFKQWLVFKLMGSDDDIYYAVEEYICNDCQWGSMKG